LCYNKSVKGARERLRNNKRKLGKRMSEMTETIEYFKEDEKTFIKPLDKLHNIWYNIDTKEKRGNTYESNKTYP
jgi:hypothetical protein